MTGRLDSMMNYSVSLLLCLALLGSTAVLSTNAAKPISNIYKIAIVGDISGTIIRDSIQKHDSAEDSGGESIVKEAPAFCGEWWNEKVGKTTMLFGFNTNGNLEDQLVAAKKVSLQGIKNVFIMSHKPCYTSPNSHHPVEPNVKAFCDSLASSIPAGIKVYYIAAHNHQLASTIDGTKFLSGGGGRSHYECGTDAVWNFCDNKNYGFLEITINTINGNIESNFVK